MTVNAPAHLIVAARELAIDVQTASVVAALREVGMEPILLKGRSFSHWLYRDGTPRGYSDSDLLVREQDRATASAVLDALGFSLVPSGTGSESAATTWTKAGSPGAVDLHTSLWLFRPPGDLWTLLQPHTLPVVVAGAPVRGLDDVAKTVHVVTHALQNSFKSRRSNTDLLRALDQVPVETWTSALALADAVGGGEAFRAGLLALQEAAELCEAIGLSYVEPPRRLQFLLDDRGDGEELILHIYRTGLRNKFAVLHGKLFPTTRYLREKHDVGVRHTTFHLAHYWWSLLRRAPRGLRNVVHDTPAARRLISLRSEGDRR